jgi:hypothetical protein
MRKAHGKVRQIQGIALGPDSPLLTKSQVLRRLGPSEADIQIQLMELLVGRARRGHDRVPGEGMTFRYPELLLLVANNPNKGGRTKAAAGIAKAMGLCPNFPDLHLPVMRGPFVGLWVELKRPGERSTRDQQLMAETLRAEGHAVVECHSVQEGLDAIVGYLNLPKNRPSVRPIAGSGPIEQQLTIWRSSAAALLTPARAGSNSFKQANP